MEFQIREPLEQLIAQGPLRDPLEARDDAVWNHDVGGTSSASDLLEPAQDVRGLNANDVGAQIDRVIDRLLQVAAPAERLVLPFGRIDNDSDERGVERTGKVRGAPDRTVRGRAAVDKDEHPVRDKAQLLARAGVLELAFDASGHQPERQLSQGGEIRLREELVERDASPIRRVDIAVLHPLSEGMRAHVNQLVNGTAGAVITVGGRPIAVMGFTIVEGKIFEIDAISDPERVRRITAAVLGDA